MGDPTALHVEAVDHQQPYVYWNHLKTILLILAVESIYFGQLILLVGAGLLSRSIAADVGGASLTAWPTAVLGLLVAAFSPPVSQAADFFGRKWFLVVLTAFGCVGCIVISRATSMGMAIAGFTVAGLSCVAQPLLHAVVSEVLPRQYRSWAQASVNVSVCFGAIFGLLVGGALTQSNPQGWRTYFYIATGIYAASALACAFLYNPPPRETQIGSVQTKLRQLDWTGYGMVGSGVTLLCVGLSWAQNPYPWANVHVLAPFLVGVVIVLALVVYEWRFKKDGLFHHRLFGNRNFPITLACVYVEGHGAFAANYFVPLELATLYPTMSSFRVGLCYSVSYFVLILSVLTAGLYIWKTRTIRVPIMAGFLGLILFFILAATSTTRTPQANFWGYMVLLGGGLGFLLTTLVVAAQFSTPPELIATTSGLVLAIRSLGGSTGLVIYEAVFSHGVSQNLVPKIAAATLPLGLPKESLPLLIGALSSGNAAALSQIPGVTPDIITAAGLALREAYSVALRYVWVTAACFTFCAFVGAAFLRDPKGEFTESIDAPLDIVQGGHHESKVVAE